jgi:AcrR family transcriptional regulator
VIDDASGRGGTDKTPERRRRILDAALELFAEQGFDQTTVQAIAEKAGVAIGTVYLYFRSKEHVLHALHEEFHRGLEAGFSGLTVGLGTGSPDMTAQDYKDMVDTFLDGLASYCLGRRRHLEVIVRYLPRVDDTEAAHDVEHGGMTELVAALLREGMKNGRIHTSDPEMTAYLITTALQETIGHCLVYHQPPDFDRLVAQAKELVYKALAPPAKHAWPRRLRRERRRA